MIKTYTGFLETKGLEFQNEALVEQALFLYAENNTDFADCVHLASAMSYNQQPLVTFDKQASKLAGIELLVT